VQGCPIDCAVSDWSAWSACSERCGGGQQSRSRRVITSAANGGNPCPELMQTRACNTAARNVCGGCTSLPTPPGQACGGCGKVVCMGSDRTHCDDPARSCQALGAACGAPADGCGGQLACGSCADALTSCGERFICACGKPTALYSPTGDLEAGKRARSPDGRWYATAAGVFTAGGQQLAPLDDAKGFDWHPSVSGRFAVMHHFAPPAARAIIRVQQLGEGDELTPIGRAAADEWFHAMAWQDTETVALGAPGACTTVTMVRPGP
jgi:hypothetical protein